MDTPKIERYKAFTVKTYRAFWDYYNNNIKNNIENTTSSL